MSKQKILEIVHFIGTSLTIIGILMLLFTPNTTCTLYKVGCVVALVGFTALFISVVMFPTPPCDKH